MLYLYLGANVCYFRETVTVEHHADGTAEVKALTGETVARLYPGTFAAMIRDGRLREVNGRV